MKKHLLYIIAALSAGLCLFSSCSLEEEAEGFISDQSKFYKTTTQCQSAINGLYPPVHSMFNFRYYMYTECHTDLAFDEAPTVTEARMDLTPALPGNTTVIWNNCYSLVMRANSVIDGIEKYCKLDESYKGAFLGEAKVMRAFAYYLLTSFYHDVPFYTDNIDNVETMNRISHLGRMSAVETRRYLIDELDTVVVRKWLPERRTSDIGVQRAGWAMANVLIAKMAMWNAAEESDHAAEWYDRALVALHRLEKVYGTLEESSYPLQNIMFKMKNTPEDIFEIENVYSSGGVQYFSNLAVTCQPKRKAKTDDDSGETITDPDGRTEFLWSGLDVPYLGNKGTYWTAMRPNVYFSGSLQINEAADNPDSYDKRAYYNMAWGYANCYSESEYLTCDTPCNPTLKGYKSFNSGDINTRPFMGPKFWCPQMYTSHDENNYPVFRYADVVLMMAECYLEKQDQTKFLKYINQTRLRAGLQSYNFRSWKKAKDELIDERARELFMEGHRKFDLVRWGIWYDRTKELNDYSTLRDNIRPCHRYLPIPDTQVIYSGNALDNDEYKKYGL